MEHMSYSMNEGMDPVMKMERERKMPSIIWIATWTDC